jgi:hypothetical protein
MKLASWFSLPKNKRPVLIKALFGTPNLSVSERIHPIKTPLPLILVKLFLSISFLFLIIIVSRKFLDLSKWHQVILISPVIYLLTEALGGVGQLTGRLAHLELPAIHDHPLRSKTLSDFWGRKWNRWVQDWLRDITSNYRRQPNKKLILTFLISGFFHELMVNLPYLIKYGESSFGNMMAYFTIQGFGLLLEKKIGHSLPSWLRRVYLWLVILIPAPLFLNHPLKLFLGLI